MSPCERERQREKEAERKGWMVGTMTDRLMVWIINNRRCRGKKKYSCESGEDRGRGTTPKERDAKTKSTTGSRELT